jgi:hypothetical protein
VGAHASATSIVNSQPSSKGKVMRARRRHFLVTLLVAVAVSIAGQSLTSSGSAAAYGCPASTSWDTVLQRCV